MTSTAVDLGEAGVDNTYGAGRIDIAAALGSLGSDTAGPVVGGLVVSGWWFAVSGTATDALSNVVAAEWFEGADPGVGLGSAMSAVDGVFDSPSEQVAAPLSLARARTRCGCGRRMPPVTGVRPSRSRSRLIRPARWWVGWECPGRGPLVTGTATDALSNVVAAEWFEGADPGVGLGSAMSAWMGCSIRPASRWVRRCRWRRGSTRCGCGRRMPLVTGVRPFGHVHGASAAGRDLPGRLRLGNARSLVKGEPA